MQELEKILERGEIIAIEELEEENERCNRSCEGCCSEMEEGKCYCKDALVISAIKKLIERIELCGDGWISVEERLPEEKRANYEVTFINECGYEEHGFARWYDGEFHVPAVVIAWRNHLEPYRPERSGDMNGQE